eukprot:3832635-Pleurochrysis_carterae.AAC.4
MSIGAAPPAQGSWIVEVVLCGVGRHGETLHVVVRHGDDLRSGRLRCECPKSSAMDVLRRSIRWCHAELQTWEEATCSVGESGRCRLCPRLYRPL